MDLQLAEGLQKCVGEMWDRDDLTDFSVVVDGTTFGCHRCIMSACSDFFQGLFRSGMKESQQNLVELQGIKKSVFEVIISSVYRGMNGLTNENFLDVWKAAVQLQIIYLIKSCERFAHKNICSKNCFRVLNCALDFNSDMVKSEALKYIAVNFEALFSKDEMLLLSLECFQYVICTDNLKVKYEDCVVKTIIKWLECDNITNINPVMDKVRTQVSPLNSHILNKSLSEKTNKVHQTVSGNNTGRVNNTDTHKPNMPERNVEKGNKDVSVSEKEATSINPLVEKAGIDQKKHLYLARSRSHSLPDLGNTSGHTYNHIKTPFGLERKQHMYQLMKTCRLFLLKHDYLEELLKKNQALKSCRETYEMLIDAFSYSVHIGRRHDCWADQAIRRKCSTKTHVMLRKDGTTLWAFDFHTEIVKAIAECSPPYNCIERFVVFDTTVYFALNNHTFAGFTKKKGFYTVGKIDLGKVLQMLAHDRHLYVLSYIKNGKSLISCRINLGDVASWVNWGTLHEHADCLVRYKYFVLIFHTFNDVIGVESFNTQEKELENLSSSMDGTSTGMVSFRYMEDVYLIQVNGSVWRIISSNQDNVIDFELVTQLWDTNIIITGCAVFKNELHLFIDKTNISAATFYKDLPVTLPHIVRHPVSSITDRLPMVIPKKWME